MYIYKISCNISAKDSTPKSILRCFCNIAHTVSLHNHTFTSWAILFDMNKLFEAFVPLTLSKTFPGQVKIQHTRQIIKDIGAFPVLVIPYVSIFCSEKIQSLIPSINVFFAPRHTFRSRHLPNAGL